MILTSCVEHRHPLPCPECPRRSRSEIRRDADGAVDDVVLLDAAMVRLERMDEGAWWLAVYPRGGGAPVVIWLSARQPGRARVEATVTELGDPPVPVVRVGP